MRASLRFLTATALAAGLASQALVAQQPPAGVGPNGESGGFVAKFADVNGIRTRYYEEGAGEPMVLLHGGSRYVGTASANTWEPVLSDLANRFHVFAVDRLATGMTDNPASDDDLNIRGGIQHIVDFIDTMNLGNVHLIGQSRGAQVALLLAANHPDLVKTLVLINGASPPAGDIDGTRTRNLFENCPREPWTALWPCRHAAYSYDRSHLTPEFIASGLWMGRRPKAQETERRMTAEMQRKVARIRSEMTYDAYSRIAIERVLQMPVLLYWGKNDPAADQIEAESLFNIIADTNPHARLLVSNAAGHFHYREHPEEFAHMVTSFVDYWNGPGAKELAAPQP